MISVQRFTGISAVAGLRPVPLLICFGLAIAASQALAADDAPVPTAKSIVMNFKDTPLETVLEQLSEMSGLVILKDVTVEGRITVISKQAMDVDAAVSLLNSVLKEKGYMGIRTGRVLKLIKLEDAKKRNIPVRTGNDPKLIEPSDEVVTQVIPIRYIDAIQLKKDFAPMIPSYADLSANAGSNTLILTDTSANIRRIVEIIAALDTQSTTLAEVKVFQLKYANATSAARLITETFKEDEQKQQPNLPPWQRGQAAFMAQQQAGDQKDLQGQRVRKVTASADDRTNCVVVSGSPETMKSVSQVIKELDSNPAEEQSVFLYRCMNAQAKNLETVVNTLFAAGSNGTLTNQTRPGTNNNNNNTNRNSATNQNGNRQQSSNGLQGLGSSTTVAPSFANQFNQQSSASTASRPQGQGMMSGDLTGQVFVVADTDTNSLIVLSASKNFERLKTILTDLDRPIPQVVIKCLIAEVTHDDTLDIGADISILTNGNIKTALTDFGVGAATGGLIAKVVKDNVSATIRALEGVTKLDILSRPYILASDNQLSTITVGQEVPFIISSRTTDTGQTINTIQYQDIGIILNVTAHINQDGLVIMDVAPEVSSLTGTTVPISENVNAPVFAKRSAQTRVGIKDGQTIVIGGLMEDKKTENIQGIPLLRRIPGLGNLFQRKQKDKSKTELLIFLTPHVAHDPGALQSMTDQDLESLKLVPKSVDEGAFDEHIRGLQSGVAPIFLPPESKPVPENKVPPESKVPAESKPR